jgi:hypothetical protein
LPQSGASRNAKVLEILEDPSTSLASAEPPLSIRRVALRSALLAARLLFGRMSMRRHAAATMRFLAPDVSPRAPEIATFFRSRCPLFMWPNWGHPEKALVLTIEAGITDDNNEYVYDESTGEWRPAPHVLSGISDMITEVITGRLRSA